MTKNMNFSVIIPAYLEEENLQIILPELQEEIAKITKEYEVLVIDTMKSKDNTKDVCSKHGAVYINRESGDNYGDAIVTGIKYAKGEYVLFMDADGSHSPFFIKNLYKYKDEYDVVIASRYVEGGSTDNSSVLILMSKVVNILYSVILNLKCKDVSNSFKLYKGQQLKKLNLKCQNFDVVEEILFKLNKHNKNLSIKEIPFAFKKRMFGSTKRNLFAFIFSYLVTILKLRFGK